MAGFTPNEGETLIAQVVHQRIHVDRDADLELGLFTTAVPDETTTEATIGEPTGGGYARKTLTDGTWGITNDEATYTQQTFTATGSYSADIYGYFVASKGTTQRLLYVEIDGAGPYTMTLNDTYDVDLSITIG